MKKENRKGKEDDEKGKKTKGRGIGWCDLGGLLPNADKNGRPLRDSYKGVEKCRAMLWLMVTKKTHT